MTISQLWPPTDVPRTLTRQVWDSATARSLPAVARAIGVYQIVQQCALQAVRGRTILPTPRLLDAPDPDMALATFIGAHVEDYWLHGNAVHLITVRDSMGRPAAARYYPAHRWGIEDVDGQPVYSLDGIRVQRDNVVHARRGVDPRFPLRGMGVVEQHLRTLNRVGLQEAAETANLTDRGMPAVVIVKPGSEQDPVNDDLVAQKWVERFSGPDPKPGIFPQGTTVTPLSWNPSDQELVQARALATKDLANLMQLDGYWLGAEGSSHTYRSPGPMFLTLLRMSIEPLMLTPLEQTWAAAWLPRGQVVRFDRTALLRDDLQSMVGTFVAGVKAELFTRDEGRDYMGWPAFPEDAPAPPTGDPPALDPAAPPATEDGDA